MQIYICVFAETQAWWVSLLYTCLNTMHWCKISDLLCIFVFGYLHTHPNMMGLSLFTTGHLHFVLVFTCLRQANHLICCEIRCEFYFHTNLAWVLLSWTKQLLVWNKNTIKLIWRPSIGTKNLTDLTWQKHKSKGIFLIMWLHLESQAKQTIKEQQTKPGLTVLGHHT